MKSVTEWLTDPDADHDPFPHQIGERLRSPAKNLDGIARKGKYAGTEDGESAWTTYYIETERGGVGPGYLITITTKI